MGRRRCVRPARPARCARAPPRSWSPPEHPGPGRPGGGRSGRREGGQTAEPADERRSSGSPDPRAARRPRLRPQRDGSASGRLAPCVLLPLRHRSRRLADEVTACPSRLPREGSREGDGRRKPEAGPAPRARAALAGPRTGALPAAPAAPHPLPLPGPLRPPAAGLTPPGLVGPRRVTLGESRTARAACSASIT